MTSFRKIRVPLFPLCWFSRRMLWVVCRLMIFLGFLINRQFTATENLKEIFPIHSFISYLRVLSFWAERRGSEPHHLKYGLQTHRGAQEFFRCKVKIIFTTTLGCYVLVHCVDLCADGAKVMASNTACPSVCH